MFIQTSCNSTSTIPSLFWYTLFLMFSLHLQECIYRFLQIYIYMVISMPNLSLAYLQIQYSFESLMFSFQISCQYVNNSDICSISLINVNKFLPYLFQEKMCGASLPPAELESICEDPRLQEHTRSPHIRELSKEDCQLLASQHHIARLKS